MNDYSVSTYGVFSDAITTTNTYSNQIDTVQSDTNSCKTTLGDSSVLMGPFQDECTRVFSVIGTDFSSLKEAVQAINQFTNQTSEAYKTADETAKNTVTGKVDTSGLSADIAAKKKAFVGDVDDDSQYTVHEGNLRIATNHMRLFDNTTGEEIPEDAAITLQKGETRTITVKLPTNTGKIINVVRTTAADTINKGDHYDDVPITSSYSDIDPSPTNKEYVNHMGIPPHWPENKSLLHTNYYDWVITADTVGQKEISTTCEYETEADKGYYLKAMAGLNITIVDDKEKKEENK